MISFFNCTIVLGANVYFAFVYYKTILAASVLFNPPTSMHVSVKVLMSLISSHQIHLCLHHSTHGTTESTPVQIFYPNRFKNDCPSGKPKLFNVEANSKINFVCPNVATMMDSTLREVTKANRYENLWLVHNSAAFDGCNVMQDPRHFLLMRCEDPTSLQFRTVIFQRYSAEHHLTFQKGKSYFFICKFQNN